MTAPDDANQAHRATLSAPGGIKMVDPNVPEGASPPAPRKVSTEERNRTILEYYPMVRAIAGRMIGRIPASVDLEEFVNIGVLGLMDAVERFDPTRGVPFKAYAEIRIRGAIVDALRASDWTPRSVRRKANQIQRTRDKLRNELNRDPTRDEMSEAVELSPDGYDTLVRDAEVRRLISINAPLSPDSTTTIADQVPSSQPDIEETWVHEEQKQEVVNAIRLLPMKERTAVTLYYLNNLTLKEIGDILGVTESRACQLRSQGIRRLKSKLE